MCADCSHKNSVEQAFKGAGFEQGTQISKIREMKLTAANTSGCRGVYYEKKTNKYRARLKFKGKIMNFGTYARFEDAVAARKRAEEEYYGTFLAEIGQTD